MISKTKSEYHITLEEAKDHVQLLRTFTEKDDELRRVIKAAVAAVESDIEKDIAKTANVLTRLDFSGSVITVNEGNLRSITSLTTTEDGESPVALSDYSTYIFRDYFKIELDDYVNTDLLTLGFVTGFDPDGEVIPWDLRQLVLMKISDFFDVDRASSRFQSIKDSGTYDRIANKYKSMIVKSQPEN